MRHLSRAGLLTLLAAASFCASARDEELCNTLGNLVPLASSKFKSIRGSKVEDNTYKARLLLPGASTCELDQDDDGDVSYRCEFQLKAGRNSGVESQNYAANIAACMPDLERTQDGTSIFLRRKPLMFQLETHSRDIWVYLHYMPD